MRTFLSALLVTALGQAAAAGEISSAYTELDVERDCAVFAAAEEGGGDWANIVCSGWRGYPVLIYSSDLRESLFYGFPPAGDLAPAWESFAAFNEAGPAIEWRIYTEAGRATPYATIHRRVVSDPEDPEERIEVLVVARVAKIHDRESCVVGLVRATGNPGANEMARRIADEQAEFFACGADERVIVGDPMPEFTRSDDLSEGAEEE